MLKQNGRIRISTPDLSFLIELYQKEKNKAQNDYLEFSVERYLNNQTPVEDVYVINNFFRDWGHQFIHDIKSLSFILHSCGFDSIKRYPVKESDDPHLQNLEQHGNEITADFNELESMVVEAVKPKG